MVNLKFNQYDYTPTKLATIQHRELVFVYDTETKACEENVDCEPYAVGFFPVSKPDISVVYRDVTDSEIIRLKAIFFYIVTL